ncbi:MAG: hypothetical protein JNK58_13490 [Phycisphaerae bacterium]|nr:hypothetical protein [Phycisphaerae bacterium]
MSHSHSSSSKLHDSATFEHELEVHDSWFRHDPSQPHHQAAHGGTNAWGINAVMVATLGLVVVTALVTYYGAFEPMMRDLREKAEARPLSHEYQTGLSAARSQFNSYEWADPAKGLVRVPLDVAMRLQMEEHKSLGAKR